MQYVRSLGSGVSKTWNSINPATLSGAIDVIVVEQEDGTLACSPFHVRFGKFSLLRPSDKKVEFKVNGSKQNYAMKLGDGGEAFFVFETSSDIPEGLQTSPLISPASSPPISAEGRPPSPGLSEPTFLDITEPEKDRQNPEPTSGRPIPQIRRHGTNLSDQLQSLPNSKTDLSGITPPDRALTAPLTLARSASEELLPVATRQELDSVSDSFLTNGILLPPKFNLDGSTTPKAPGSPPSLRPKEAYDRAMTLSKKLSISNIRSQVTESGDLMLDMTGYKSSEDEALRAEAVARKLLSEELEGNYDIGSLIGTDENGNLWIYSSEEARDAALQKAAGSMLEGAPPISMDNASDPGYHSDSDRSASPEILGKASSLGHQRAQSEEITPSAPMSVDPGRNFAKTLRLTSDQLKALNLKSGRNQISFTVNRATCTAYMYYWTSDVPIVISDIDGTITKSDALGHLLNMVGRDWTHAGVAKLYSDIVANGYNILYLTSRSVGQADTTRAYLNGIVQDGWRLPEGPVILSPDRTIAALRREVYLRKPEVFKMACLRDILGLFPGRTNPFYAGFGNRFTDALSYRSVHIPSTRIFTINTNAEVSLDLLTLNKYRSSYVTMREVVDHFFPPVSTLVKEGGEDYTDFTYWRDLPQDLDNFTPTDSEAEEDEESDEEEEEEEAEVESDNELGDSFMSRDSLEDSIMSESIRQSIEIDNTAEALEESRLDDDGDDEREADFADDYLGGDDAQRRKASQTPTPRSPRR
ncbi:lipin Ned1 [Exophiala xenobiotica]|uniref:Lipin Ned1 n=1 Tax=Vermiconidia calcicola TaxID=1690605 RepID=A0AAV9PTY9_9PEZI|nr:lipin Ned1 [Exophiala xenobiotica]KAK5527871.1 lipin Ned1 [Vermiconidia calcicola]KAK5216096.1 lipin Ned1 [Exophiala xenobiotica]KAK5269777.1 lipin Ned1 [Exophiala xenobiotica]KAK5397767.1 lipin Ned1 [Exophiala xenobiotica]